MDLGRVLVRYYESNGAKGLIDDLLIALDEVESEALAADDDNGSAFINEVNTIIFDLVDDQE